MRFPSPDFYEKRGIFWESDIWKNKLIDGELDILPLEIIATPKGTVACN